jgi:HEAT repeat protein
MLHRLFALALLGLVMGGLSRSAWAEEEEPSIGGKKLSAWLGQLHEGKTTRERIQGVVAVELIGYSGSKKVVPALIKAMREDKEPTVRARAARAVGRAVGKALEQARAEKKDELPRFDFARDALGTALRTEKVEAVREAAALGLGDLGPDARGVVGSLAQGLKDTHAGTVKASAASLRRMGKDAREAQPELQTILANKKAEVEPRVDAAISLGQIRPDVSSVLPVLKEVLSDTTADLRIRRAVAESLGKLGKEAADATSTLANVLVARESVPELRLAAVMALDQFGGDAKSAIPSLIKAIADPALIKSMGDQARYIRCLALHALGRMGKELDKERKDAVQAILKAADDPNVEVCVSAVESLGSLGIEGLGGELDDVKKKIEIILTREGRKSIREAAQATRDKLRPKK